MYIRSLHIANLRCFRGAELLFQYPGRTDASPLVPNVNLILGDNGAGKSSILKAVALSTLSPLIASSGFLPYRLVRQTPSETAEAAEVGAEVMLHGQDTGQTSDHQVAVDIVQARIERRRATEQIIPSSASLPHWERIYDEASTAFFIAGYGASRQVESESTIDPALRRKTRLPRYERVAGLFEEGVTLTPLGAWLPSVQAYSPDAFQDVIDMLNHLLPDECRFRGVMESSDFLFEMRGVPVPFGALSDGYRAYIGWITDLMYQMNRGAPPGTKLVENRGIVLVDEIDLHLHPEWQRTVIPRISQALPNLQFVFTTHSPIVAGTLAAENIFLVQPHEAGASSVRQLQERIHGLSAEQILLSSYFQLDTTRAPDAEVQLSNLAHQARRGDPQAAIDYLRTLTEGSDSEDEEMAIS